jgi:hypothetical protein
VVSGCVVFVVEWCGVRLCGGGGWLCGGDGVCGCGSDGVCGCGCVLVVVARLWLCVGGCGEVVVVCWWLCVVWCEVMVKSLGCQPPECDTLKGEDTLEC